MSMPIKVNLSPEELRADALHGRQRQQLAEEAHSKMQYDSNIGGLEGHILSLHGETGFFKLCDKCKRKTKPYEDEFENILHSPDIIFPDEQIGELKTRHFVNSKIKVLFENQTDYNNKTKNVYRLVFATIKCASGLPAIEAADEVLFWGYLPTTEVTNYPLKEVQTSHDVIKSMAFHIPVTKLIPLNTEWLSPEYAEDRPDGWFG